jgi:hypothetical protein
MKSYRAEQVINGTWGEVWIDSDYIAEVTEFEAKLSLNTADVTQTRTFAKGQKVIGTEGKGTVTMNKVTSYFHYKVGDYIRENKTPPAATIISKLADPDSLGAERVKITGVQFSEIDVANWAAAKLGEVKMPFTFTSYEPLDLIPDA